MEHDVMQDAPQAATSRWKIHARTVLSKNPWYEYRHDQGQTDHGKTYNYYYVYKKQSAGIVALDEEGKLIMVRQYRYLLNTESLEIPGGSTQGADDVFAIARQELMEETGYEATDMRLIGNLAVASGHCTDRMAVFFATGCHRKQAAELEHTELGMVVETYDPAALYAMIEAGKLIDPLTIASLALARPYLPKASGFVKV